MSDDTNAMCDEIAAIIGVRYRKPGQVAVREYAERVGITDTAAKRQLDRLVKKGILQRERVLWNGSWRVMYSKVDADK